MKKYFVVALVLLPLTVSASNVVKDTIKAKRKYEHSKSHITNTLDNTKRDIEEITSGTYVKNQAKREAKQATSKYTNKVENVKNATDPEHIKRKASDELNREFDEWLYDDN
ncbi:hypothetical protein AB3Y13_10795 [Vibrio alginolyticus]|uniref:hypothetical protein n=1 Tax=Vibrio sp. B1FLJ16 TaxID=2751178 RepID=UPI0015F606DA|nr:hypothetical protein [Vibrio sp. B1FLJ16]CAD7799647.1 hypothetical protein ACOMICROBIO_FLGHMIGD_00516 [Vibrio sp. B1FLJ16]CAE6885695.1 hypothetical protein ACOMICROBIO_FLGHMIGD_00516 [Vibrio sp. B1FLJ16]